MASALIYTHERYQSNGLSSRDGTMKKAPKLQKGYVLEPVPPEAAAGTEAVAESDGRRQRHPLLRNQESTGGPGKPDPEAGSEDSRTLKRKSMSLNADGVKDANSDVAGVDSGQFLDVPSLSKQERKAYRKRLRLDLEKIQALYPRIDAREQELSRLNTPDGERVVRRSNSLGLGRADNGVSAGKEASLEPVTTPTDTPRGPMSQRDGRLARAPSVIVPDPMMGTPGIPSKEKRTPKANQLYLNSEFVSGKERIPLAEKLKPKAAASLKRGSVSKLDLKDAKRQKIQNARSKRMADLLKQCGTLLKRLSAHRHAWVFREPVDVVKLGLHDYTKVIRKPMDLGTIKKNLEAGVYDTPAEFADDVRLVFSNALTYNPKGHDVHAMAEILNQNFEARWKGIEEKYEEEKMKIKVEDEALSQGDGHNQQIQDLMQKNLENQQKIQSLEYQFSTLSKGRGPGAGRGTAAGKLKPESQKRAMTFDDKRKLSTNLELLPPEKLGKIVQILKKRNPNLAQDQDEIIVDIDTFDNDTLWELERFVANCMKSLAAKSKKKGNQTTAAPEAGEPHADVAPAQAGGESSKTLRKGENGDEEVDIDDHAPPAPFPPVEIEKDAAVCASKSSSSSSSDSESASSDSDSDSGSSSGSDSDAEEAQSADAGAKGSPESKEPVGSGAVRDQKGSCALETDGAKRDVSETVEEAEAPKAVPPDNGGKVSNGGDSTGGVAPMDSADDQRQGSGESLCAEAQPAKAGKPIEKHVSGIGPPEECSPTGPGRSDSPGSTPMDTGKSANPASEKHGSPKAGSEMQGSPAEAPAERQLSPEKALRAARMRDRFADTILKAHEKTSNKNEKVDPEKLRKDREELEKRQREEKARLQAEARAAEVARKKAEAEAHAENLRKREAEREAARVALQQMEKTVEIDENCEILKDLEMMGTTQLDLPSSGEDGSPDGSPEGRPNFGGPGIKPLEQLGLFMRQDEEEEEEQRLDKDPVLNVDENGDSGDVEEGEID